MAHLGERLRQQRIAQGVELSAVASETRIGVPYLEAIENGDWTQLPGSIFARSFIRQYARSIGFDESLIKNELQSIFQTQEALPTSLTEPEKIGFKIKPLSEIASIKPSNWGSIPKPMISLAVVLSACSVVYMGWQRLVLGHPGTDGRTQSASDPAQSAPPIKPPASVGLPSNAPDGDPVAQMAASSESGPASDGHTASVVELSAPESANGATVVQIVALQESWVSITANGSKLFSGTLRPNESRRITGVAKAKMVIGNAGGVEIRTDGRSIGTIGPAGQVRIVLLTPDGAQIIRNTKSESSEGSSLAPSQT